MSSCSAALSVVCDAEKPHIARSTSRTFRHQSSLPRLPIPSLDETLANFPKVISALETMEEQEETKKIVEEFRNGDGPKLQALLDS